MRFRSLWAISSVLWLVSAGIAAAAPAQGRADLGLLVGDHGSVSCNFSAHTSAAGGASGDAYDLMISVTAAVQQPAKGLVRLQKRAAPPSMETAHQLAIAGDGLLETT